MTTISRRRFRPDLMALETKVLLDGSYPSGYPGGGGSPSGYPGGGGYYYNDGPGPLAGMVVQGAAGIEGTDANGVTTYYAAPGMHISVQAYTNFPSKIFELAVGGAKKPGSTFAQDDYAEHMDLPSPVTHDYTSSNDPRQSDNFSFIVGAQPGVVTVTVHAHTIHGGLKTGKFKLNVEMPSGLVKVKGNSGLVYGNVDPNTGIGTGNPDSGQQGWYFSGASATEHPITFTGIVSPPAHVSGKVFFTQLVKSEVVIYRQSGDFLYMATSGFVQDGGPYVYQNYTESAPAGQSFNFPREPIFGATPEVWDAPRITPPTKAGDPFTSVTVKRSFETMLMWQAYSTNGSVPVVISTATWEQNASNDPQFGIVTTPNGPFEAEGDATVKFPEWIGRMSDGQRIRAQGDWPLAFRGQDTAGNGLWDLDGSICYAMTPAAAPAVAAPAAPRPHAAPAPLIAIPIPIDLLKDVHFVTKKGKKK